MAIIFGMLLIKAEQNSLGALYQVFCENFHKSYLFLKVRAPILFLYKSHKFSKGFRPEDWLGQVTRSTLLSLNHF